MTIEKYIWVFYVYITDSTIATYHGFTSDQAYDRSSVSRALFYRREVVVLVWRCLAMSQVLAYTCTAINHCQELLLNYYHLNIQLTVPVSEISIISTLKTHL